MKKKSKGTRLAERLAEEIKELKTSLSESRQLRMHEQAMEERRLKAFSVSLTALHEITLCTQLEKAHKLAQKALKY